MNARTNTEMSTTRETELLPGWNDPVHDSQSTFRAVLKALSEPGSIQMVVADMQFPPPLFLATTALCLALADPETSVWLDQGANLPVLQAYLRFHCGCQLEQGSGENAMMASFGIITEPIQLGIALEKFSHGTMEYPDRSTTLLVQVPALRGGPERCLSGPGIAHQCLMSVAGLPDNFDACWKKNSDGFPLGVDLIFCCGAEIIGLPRTTNIAALKR